VFKNPENASMVRKISFQAKSYLFNLHEMFKNSGSDWQHGFPEVEERYLAHTGPISPDTGTYAAYTSFMKELYCRKGFIYDAISCERTTSKAV
jgi:hypothetical protein